MTVAPVTVPTALAAEAIKPLLLDLLNTPKGIDPKGAMALAHALRSASQAQTGRTEK